MTSSTKQEELMKDAELRDKSKTALRFNNGKVKYELIPTHLLESTARVLEKGAQKYSAWNWCKPGMSWTEVIGCLKRHLAEIERGNDYDDGPNGTGERHIGHMICNLLFLEHYMNVYPEHDDRTHWFKEQKEPSPKTTENSVLKIDREMIQNNISEYTKEPFSFNNHPSLKTWT